MSRSCLAEDATARAREAQGSGWVKHEPRAKPERAAPQRVANAAEQVHCPQ